MALAVLASGAGLQLKTRSLEAAGDSRAESPQPLRWHAGSRAHLLLQFEAVPTPGQLEELKQRGASPLGYVPDLGLMVAVEDDTDLTGLGLKWTGVLAARDKLSPEVDVSGGSGAFLIEFHPDVPPEDALALLEGNLFTPKVHPDLLPNQFLVDGDAARVARLSDWEEVAYIFPASRDLAEGLRVVACSGGLTAYGTMGQYVAHVGDGWDGPGRNTADIGYFFPTLTGNLPGEKMRSEILRAFAEWSRHVAVHFHPESDPDALKTISVLFAAGQHGDGFPFAGPGRILAHTFFPAPPIPEPVAGDMHFNADEPWSSAIGPDLFSVALHESGHALGLGHSDRPGSVMYPYYRKATVLTQQDIAAIREMYAASRTENPGPETPSALRIVVQSPASSGLTVIADRILLAGSVEGATGEVQISWHSGNATGSARTSRYWSFSVPLRIGENAITLEVRDGLQRTASETLRLTLAAEPNRPGDTAPPALTITSPASTTISTSNASIRISGTARDTAGVAAVTWQDSLGNAGTAQGTTYWATGDIPLREGTNTITIRARDAAGNESWRSLVITRVRRPPARIRFIA
jgi:hypothetical protein